MEPKETWIKWVNHTYKKYTLKSLIEATALMSVSAISTSKAGDMLYSPFTVVRT